MRSFDWRKHGGTFRPGVSTMPALPTTRIVGVHRSWRRLSHFGESTNDPPELH